MGFQFILDFTILTNIKGFSDCGAKDSMFLKWPNPGLFLFFCECSANFNYIK